MCGISDKALSELRIARAYIKLLCLPEGSSRASVSLASIGSYEIRIFEGSQTNPDGVPLFYLELFDHGANASIDSCGCQEIEDAVVAYQDFAAQAGRLSEACRPDAQSQS